MLAELPDVTGNRNHAITALNILRIDVLSRCLNRMPHFVSAKANDGDVERQVDFEVEREKMIKFKR